MKENGSKFEIAVKARAIRKLKHPSRLKVLKEFK